MLTDLSLKSHYRSGRDSLLDDFYIPCLQESVNFDRAVGYFSSALYQAVGLAFSDFVKRDGHVRLICSPELSIGDYEAIKSGRAQASSLAQESVRQELESLLRRPESVPATRLLASLVAANVIEIQIAFSENPKGLFHDKIGIFEDSEGKKVAFSGSANESFRAWGLNHESFSVFCSWDNEVDLMRAREISEFFRSVWTGREPGIEIATIDEITKEQLRSVAYDDLDFGIEQVRSCLNPSSQMGQVKELLEHQLLVLEDWEARGHRGIISFATGAGKTIAAIEGIKRWNREGGTAIVLVPGRDLHVQWMRELASQYPEATVLPAGAGHRKSDWMDLLSIFTSAEQEVSLPKVVLATNSIFAGDDFQNRLRAGEHLLVVSDEVHRAGSPKVLAALENVFCGGALGLSATYERQYDEDGSERILKYFGETLSPVIGIAEALALGLLVPYDYRLHEVGLDFDEEHRYEKLTAKISRAAARNAGGDEDNQVVQMLLIERSRILKQARQKIPVAVEVLRDQYEDGQRWLVYCDDTVQLEDLTAKCLELNLPVMEFHSNMESEREAVIRSLSGRGGIVIAIRCLDEGIDIPVADHALILASSTVEREYIQRRGRVLRAAPGTTKVSAEIHDLILVDEYGGALTRGEAVRALEFARLARNEVSRDRLKAMVALSRDVTKVADFSEDDEE